MSEHSRSVPVVSCESAARLVEAAKSHAHASGWSIAVAVVDPWGAVVASGRMDGVSPVVPEIATDKAYTAALGKSSKEFFERMSSTAELTLGLQTRPRLCAWEGGLPIREGEQLIGAIGVSGAVGPEDSACASAALNALGLN